MTTCLVFYVYFTECFLCRSFFSVTGQFADNQLFVSQVVDCSTHGLVNSPKCLIYNLEYIISRSVISDRSHYLYTANINRVTVMVRVRFNVQIKCSNSMIFKNSLSASLLVCELSSPRLDWRRVGLSANCPVSLFSYVILLFSLSRTCFAWMFCRMCCVLYVSLPYFVINDEIMKTLVASPHSSLPITVCLKSSEVWTGK